MAGFAISNTQCCDYGRDKLIVGQLHRVDPP
jgi:hypothetical protein